MVREEVFKIVSEVLKVPLAQVNDDTSPQTLSQWDSLQHMILILALEKKFAIKFHEDQIVNMNMQNVRIIVAAVEELKK